MSNRHEDKKSINRWTVIILSLVAIGFYFSAMYFLTR